MHKDAQKKNLHGISVARRAPEITHLLFADDSLLFALANLREAESITLVLNSYQLASGQLVNLDKSEVSFSRNVPNNEQQMICDTMEVKIVTSHTRYLGLPVVFGRSKKDVFSFVQERVWKKLKGWKEKCLSRAGKETLIKSVAQAIPNYIMSCYKIPDGCCKNIEGMLAKFWWGSSENKRKIHRLSWDRLGKAKDRGGLGFRGFCEFNKALLGKQCWRLINGDNTLMAKVFKSRYFPRSNFMTAKIGYQPSYAWRSLMNAREVIDLGARWLIGNGQQVSIWNDNWMPEQSRFKVWSPVVGLPHDAKVSELIDPDLKKWRRDLVFSIFSHFEGQQIMSIPISLRLPEDRLIWHWEKDGEYLVRSTYHQLVEERSRNNAEPSNVRGQKIWKEIWTVDVLTNFR